MNVVRGKFRGCLLGALFGDALGAIFEGEYWDRPVPLPRLEELSKEQLSALEGSNRLLTYTDDTAMTKVICRSLVSNQSFNVSDVAKGFVEEYFREPLRGYGTGVVKVFERLHSEHHEDVFVPAREQFDGTGSYGNGAAMRISPLALFCGSDLETLKKTAKQSALITHAHHLGVHGAILQAVAVHEALNTTPGSLDVGQYIDKLIDMAEDLERQDGNTSSEETNKINRSGDSKDDDNDEQRSSYVSQFQRIKRLLLNNEDKPQLNDVIKTLGHGVKAVEAVPAAIFSFLCKANASIEDAILYAISLGGDTDTIGSMAGAIAGAYWGEQSIPKEWFLVTESVNEVIQYADELHNLREKQELGNQEKPGCFPP